MYAHILSSASSQVDSESRDAGNACKKNHLFPFVSNTEKAYNLSQDRISNMETLQQASPQLIQRSEIQGRDARLCPRPLQLYLA